MSDNNGDADSTGDGVTPQAPAPIRSRVDPHGFYAVLGLDPTDDDTAVRRAFRLQSTLFHTDRHAGGRTTSHERELMNRRFQRLNEAYQVLADPQRRAAYDHSGLAGVERLALVPASVTTPQQLRSVLDALAREAEAKRVAKAVSAAGGVTLSLNATPLFDSAGPQGGRRGAGGRVQPTLEALMPQAQQEPARAKPVEAVPEHAAPAETAVTPASTPEGDAAAQAAAATPPPAEGAPALPTGHVQMNVQPLKLTIDGKSIIVLVPPPELQRRLAKQAGLQMEGEEEGTAPASQQQQQEQQGTAVARRTPRPQLMSTGVVASGFRRFIQAATPYNVAMSQSFDIPWGPTRTLSVSAHMEQTNKVSGAGGMANSKGRVTLALELAKSAVTELSASVRLSLGSVPLLRMVHTRVLNERWTLRNALDVYDKAGWLPKYTLEWVRKLSTTTSVVSALAMSLTGGGSFRTSLVRAEIVPGRTRSRRRQRGRSDGEGARNTGDGGAGKQQANEGGKANGNGKDRDESRDGDQNQENGSGQTTAEPTTKQTNVNLNIGAHMVSVSASFQTTLRGWRVSGRDGDSGGSSDDDDESDASDDEEAAKRRAGGSGSATQGGAHGSAAGGGGGWLGRVASALRRDVSLTTEVGFDPFSGRTNVAYELWFRVRSFQRVGFGVSSALPFAPNPCVPHGWFLSWAAPPICLTQVHLMYRQHNHKFTVPIVVSVSQRASRGLVLLALPLAGMRLARVVLAPLLRAATARRNVRRRIAARAALLAARGDALAEQNALRTAVEARRELEQAVPGGGLVIINARYGVLNVSASAASAAAAIAASMGVADVPLDIDVTLPLQALVRDSQLRLPDATKSILAGFYNTDPFAPRAARSLRVVYWFRGARHATEVRDDEPLALPQRSHLVAAAAQR